MSKIFADKQLLKDGVWYAVMYDTYDYGDYDMLEAKFDFYSQTLTLPDGSLLETDKAYSFAELS